VIPDTFRATLKLRALGLLKIPMLFFISPTVVELSEKRCVVRVPLTWRTRNHLGSMYFGVLAAGADSAGGLMAWRLIEESGKDIALIFKDFHAKFLKRAEGDVFFTCEQGDEIADLVRDVASSAERKSMPVRVTATVPSKLGSEPVAEFTLTLSLKQR
jgi:acyl-coenzyme A thioesterase PaaI-like protein